MSRFEIAVTYESAPSMTFTHLVCASYQGTAYQVAEKASGRVILSPSLRSRVNSAKCRSLLEDLAVIGTKDLLFNCFQ